MEIRPHDIARLRERNKHIAVDACQQLHYLGNYVRDIPSNLTRMMENAHDWEHLPFVHPSSFAAIEPVDTGTWGWRCKVELPNNGGEQLIELLVDNDNYYWATTVVEGPGQGTQIHTQASDNDVGGITVDVRFYLPQAPEHEQQAAMILGYLQAQYATLYDEDEALMLGRQVALDERRALRGADGRQSVDLGDEAALDRSKVHEANLGDTRVLVRHWYGEWTAYSARCPHALGPLDDVEPDVDGLITCPWHGYRFDLATGVEMHRRCGALSLYAVTIVDGRLLVQAS